MAYLSETSKWETGVYQIEMQDPVLGGADGIVNIPLKQICNRLLYLKDAAGTAETDIGALQKAVALCATTEALKSYALKTDLNNYALASSLSVYALKTALDDYALVSSLSVYAKKSDLADYALKNEVPVPSTTTPKAPGTAAVGTETTFARGDHVHPAQTDITGSSGSCTGLAAKATADAAGNVITGTYAKDADVCKCTQGASLSIYISKSGSDSNDGLTSSAPVLTVNKALRIAKIYAPYNQNAYVKFCVGAGEWDDAIFSNLPYAIYIYPFSGQVATEYSEDLPVFGNIRIYNGYAYLYGVCCGELISKYHSFVALNYYNRITAAAADTQSYIQAGGTIDISASSDKAYVFYAAAQSFLSFIGGTVVNIAGNITIANGFLQLGQSSCCYGLTNAAFNIADKCGVTGRKYYFASFSNAYGLTKAMLDALSLPGSADGLISNSLVNGIPYGDGSTSKFLRADGTWVDLESRIAALEAKAS